MRKVSIPCATLFAMMFAFPVVWAQHLPATPPTAVPMPPTRSVPIQATVASSAPHQAEVTYTAGLLDVRADNSSLNQILRQIGHLTSTTITGGVADQRVFGNYGPARLGTVLATLLDGTGSNMLLRVSTTPNVPSELVLTPRNGSLIPPSPNSNIYAEVPTQPTRHLGPPPRMFTQRYPPPIVTRSTPPSVNSRSNPNGVATPQDVFQRLKALQQARLNATQQQSTATH